MSKHVRSALIRRTRRLRPRRRRLGRDAVADVKQSLEKKRIERLQGPFVQDEHWAHASHPAQSRPPPPQDMHGIGSLARLGDGLRADPHLDKSPAISDRLHDASRIPLDPYIEDLDEPIQGCDVVKGGVINMGIRKAEGSGPGVSHAGVLLRARCWFPRG